jgi:hypothetical protein
MADINAKVQRQGGGGSGKVESKVQHKPGSGKADKMSPQPRGAQHRDRESGVAGVPKPWDAYGEQKQY